MIAEFSDRFLIAAFLKVFHLVVPLVTYLFFADPECWKQRIRQQTDYI